MIIFDSSIFRFFFIPEILAFTLNFLIFIYFLKITEMRNFYLGYILFGICSLFSYTKATAQSVISGTITDEKGNPVSGVNIILKGSQTGTATDTRGMYKLALDEELPVTLLFSAIGFASVEKEITQETLSESVDIQLSASTLLEQEVVVSASRVEENILHSPVTIEKLDILEIQQAATTDFYDKLVNIKGVNVIAGSLTFTSINTRGFATNANTRFVQLVDWVDNAAPILNFPTGNLVGLSELEVESIELIPGASSALYGPNAFNGILILNSKNPFDYQGLSAQIKGGFTRQDVAGTNPLYNASFRYAKAFNDKWAFKIHGSVLDAEDWQSNVYDIDRSNLNQRLNISDPNFTGVYPAFDGLNLYGDDIKIPIPINTTFANAVELGAIPQVASFSAAQRKTLADGMRQLQNPIVTRTGFREQDLFDSFDARSIKIGGALHYKINDRLELSGSYIYGSGSSIYQGAQKYAIRDFSQQFVKVELRADNFFVRGYTTFTDAGKSYNLDALGAFVNESFSSSTNTWVPTYGLTYAAARLGLLRLLAPDFSSVPGTELGTQINEETAHLIARSAADANIPKARSETFNSTVKRVREAFFQTEEGAAIFDNSRMYHGEFNYNFKKQITFIDLQIGGNFRQYDLFSDGTVYNEDPDNTGDRKRIAINEFGVYTQVIKRFFNDRLKLTGSLRYDKNENFRGQITPRISGVFTVAKIHNIRASYQTGFRNPDTQAQFIFFPTSTGVILGGTRVNAERYKVYEVPVKNSFDTTQSLTLNYVQPEQLTSIEVGYKAVIFDKLLIDINYYRNSYKDFISQASVISPSNSPLANEIALVYTNSPDKINSQGVGIGFQYNAPKNFILTANYTWSDFSAPERSSRFLLLTFNTPENAFNLGVANRNIFNTKFGFGIDYHWQQEFRWQSSFVPLGGYIPSYHLLNAQINYTIPSIKTILKIGGTNALQKDYLTSLGGPKVGSQFYFSITFDQSIQ